MNYKSSKSLKKKNKNFNLDTTDLKILEAIYSLQNLKTAKIAEKIKLSEITVKRRLGKLRKYRLITKKHVVNFWKIKLTPLIVIGQKLLPKIDKKILDTYCKSIKTLIASVTHHILKLLVPADDLNNVLKYFQAFKNVDIYLLKSFHESVSFRFFDIPKNTWEIDYLALSLYIKEIIVKEEYLDILKQTSPIKTIYKKPSSKPIKLSNNYPRKIIDFETLLNKDISLNLNLKISKHTAYKIKNKLKKVNALKTYIDIHPPKLTEKIYIIIENSDPRFLEALLLGLSELPKLSFYKAKKLNTQSKSSKENVTIIKLELPERGFVNFIENFTKMLIDNTDFKLYIEI